jgi:hypothetical protein
MKGEQAYEVVVTKSKTTVKDTNCDTLTNYMEHSPSWEANSSSASQKIPRILWNPEVHYHVHKSPPLVPTQSHSNPDHDLPPDSWRSILIL